MSSKKNLSVVDTTAASQHSRIGKTISADCSGSGGNSAIIAAGGDRNNGGGGCGVVRSKSTALVEAVRHVRLIGDGYRPGDHTPISTESSSTADGRSSTNGKGDAEIFQQGQQQEQQEPTEPAETAKAHEKDDKGTRMNTTSSSSSSRKRLPEKTGHQQQDGFGITTTTSGEDGVGVRGGGGGSTSVLQIPPAVSSRLGHRDGNNHHHNTGVISSENITTGRGHGNTTTSSLSLSSSSSENGAPLSVGSASSTNRLSSSSSHMMMSSSGKLSQQQQQQNQHLQFSTSTSSSRLLSVPPLPSASASLVAPYHLSRNVLLSQQNQSSSSSSSSSDRPVSPSQNQQNHQQTRQQQQPHHQSTSSSSRPTALVRLTRNGPFCPCFSPNDSDTEPSSPVARTSTPPAAAVNAGGGARNMASLARELRARFVTGQQSVTISGGVPAGQQQAQQQQPVVVARRAANEAMHMVAEPYPVQVHTQVEYTHYLVPDLSEITRAPYYWGVMDRFEAERLLENQPEGTFLLRDSAQSEYLFSVSFRRYNRTLHARIEQMNHRFSFDSYDPNVFNAPTVTALIENYKDPSKVLFFEPQLSTPLRRNFAFPLQHLCRAVIASSINYHDINHLQLPKKFKDYLREYHYKHPVRVTKLE